MVIQQQTIQTAHEEMPVSSCCHHWVIEPANGPISRGVCRHCNESREFKNSIVDPDREVSPNGKPDSWSPPGATEE